jgi:hypothetical protein
MPDERSRYYSARKRRMRRRPHDRGPPRAHLRPRGSPEWPPPRAIARLEAPRRGGRAVHCTGLENRQRRKSFVGSNPTPSAILQGFCVDRPRPIGPQDRERLPVGCHLVQLVPRPALLMATARAPSRSFTASSCMSGSTVSCATAGDPGTDEAVAIDGLSRRGGHRCGDWTHTLRTSGRLRGRQRWSHPAASRTCSVNDDVTAGDLQPQVT